ncbi:hypothetical protein MTR67_048629 [Solanum verrucosum]|uniref:Uncharacterized protein n=1 Tax=Solanum verrucosum TaxID=315347 RepID=A0AAF0V158_SOLVR|nr:hypothetical protein MTR67_048629 [Solanum verrucosum]
MYGVYAKFMSMNDSTQRSKEYYGTHVYESSHSHPYFLKT